MYLLLAVKYVMHFDLQNTIASWKLLFDIDNDDMHLWW